ncbi:MAG: glycosyltransferase [Hyphomicrobiales bacterium]
MSIIDRPLVTIGITSFNAAETIELAIQSALSQNWYPKEIVIVDDSSTDDTHLVIDKYSQTYDEVRFFYNEINSGVAVTRNRIIEEAKGEFLVFFDDDDESQPDRIEHQVRRIVEYEKEFANHSPVICHTARNVTYTDGNISYEKTMGCDAGGCAPNGEAVAKRILLGHYLKDGYGACPTCSQMARVKTYRDIGGFDPNLRRSEDTEFIIRLSLQGGHFVGINEPLVSQKMTKTSDKNITDEHKNMIYIIEKHRSFIEEAGEYEFTKNWLELKSHYLKRDYFYFLLSLMKLITTHPLKTYKRIFSALPNFNLNRRFSRFHKLSK